MAKDYNYKKLLIKIGIPALSILAIYLLSNLDAGEWCWYNLYYSPLYFLFSKLFYCAFFTMVFGIIIISLFFIAAIWVFVPDMLNGNNSKLKRIGAGCIIAFYLFALFFIGKPQLLDAELIWNGEYLSIDSDLSRYKRIITSGTRGGSSYSYKLHTYEIEENPKYWRRGEPNLDSYEYLHLNVYQYKKLEQLKLEHSIKGDSINVPIKVYYLPNTRHVLRFEIIN